MNESEAIKLGYEVDNDYPIASVLFKNGKEIEVFLIENFGWRWPTLHHPEVLNFISLMEKETK